MPIFAAPPRGFLRSARQQNCGAVYAQGSARLATGTVAEEIERLRTEPGEGNIAIGGAGLAATIAEADLIDEYRAKVYPVLVGGGVPFFPQAERRVDLELLETRSFDSGVVYLRHRVRR